MFQRDAQEEARNLFKTYPVLTVLGPRQAGKTTLVRETFPDLRYGNLENIDERELALQDPKAYLKPFLDGGILDEIQNAPELLSYIQTEVDERGKNSLLVLTGSHQLRVHEAISQSLAGRTAILKLLPMSLGELSRAGFRLSIDEAIFHGGYPRIFASGQEPSRAYKNYYQTYVERDLHQLIKVKDLMQFQTFIRLCAGRIGQLCNFEGLSKEVGVSSNTIREWLSVLEASFILFRLPPYYENFGKRMVKSSKIYFYDLGLASYLLGLEEASQVGKDPLLGNLFENLVLLEILKARSNRSLDPMLYFFRDHHGREIDLIFQKGRQLLPIEIKSSESFNSSFLKNISFLKETLGDRALTPALIYGGSEEMNGSEFRLVNFRNAAKVIESP